MNKNSKRKREKTTGTETTNKKSKKHTPEETMVSTSQSKKHSAGPSPKPKNQVLANFLLILLERTQFIPHHSLMQH